MDLNLVRVNNLIVVYYIAHKFCVEYLWQKYLNYLVPKYFFEGIYHQYNDNCTDESFCLCPRIIGNLTLKILWAHFIHAKAIYLDAKSEKQAVFLEEFCGNQEITDFYGLVDSPHQSSALDKATHNSATKLFTVHLALLSL